MRFVRVGFLSHMGSGWDSLIESREIFHIVSYSSVIICYEVEDATQHASVRTLANPSIDIETHMVSGDREEDIYMCDPFVLYTPLGMDGRKHGGPEASPSMRQHHHAQKPRETMGEIECRLKC